MNGTDHTSDRTDGASPDDPRELLGAWALDAVDDDERRRVDELLASDPEARAEAERLVAVADGLAEASAGADEAPPGLLGAILGRIDDRDADAPGTTAAAPPAAPPVASAPPVAPAAATTAGSDPAETVAGLTELERRRAARASRRRSRAPWILSAAAAVILLVVGGVVVATRDDASEPTLEEVAAEAAAQPGARTADLVTDTEIVAAQLVVDPEGHGYLTVHDMPATDETHTYQLWSVDGGTPISLGLFDGASTVAVVGVDRGVTQLAVTLEPAGGSADPTTAPMASGALAEA